MTPGGIAVRAAFLLAVVATVAAVRWGRGSRQGEAVFRWAYHAMTGALVLASILLLRAILTHDFRFEYVIGYSSRDLPLLYLVSAFWGGQEGTYLLWALFGALVGYALYRKGAWQPATVMAFYVPTVGILTGLMLNRNADPFRLVAQVPPDGRGLNPLLQDPWMAAHPPVVFLGYAALTVPAVLAWVAIFRKDEKNWLAPALRWSLIGFIVLGVGIILGAFWAYKVLGWGGFWGWDPVENASLIPWIVVVALLHGILIQKATHTFRLVNLILAMGCYLLVIYATFLTRSGVLADFSVHSFPKGTVYAWLVAILVLVLALSFFALLRRKRSEEPPFSYGLAWPLVLGAVIVLLVVSAVVVLVGTSWPILTSALGRAAKPASDFYNQVNLPLYVLLLAALGLGPFLGWGVIPSQFWRRRLIVSVAAALAGTSLALLFGGRGVESLVLFFFALLALASNAARLVEMARVRWLNTGAAVAHVGFALIFLGIVASSAWDDATEVRLPLGQPVQAFGHQLIYKGHVKGSEPKHRWQIDVAQPGRSPVETSITMYDLNEGYNDRESSLFRKPAILRSFTEDFYLAPVELHDAAGAEGGILDLTKQQPFDYQGATLTFDRFLPMESHGENMTVRALLLTERDGKVETDTLRVTVGAAGWQGTPVPIGLLPGTTLTLQRMNADKGQIRLAVEGGAAPGEGTPETLVLEATIKPLIWVLWTGTIVLSLGCLIAVIRRTVDGRAPKPRAAAAR